MRPGRQAMVDEIILGTDSQFLGRSSVATLLLLFVCNRGYYITYTDTYSYIIYIGFAPAPSSSLVVSNGLF